MLWESLAFIKTEEGDAAGIAMDDFFTDYAVFCVIYGFIGYKYFAFFYLSQLYQ